ncbi:MAG TPA: extracellular solute-binding protein [Candidatus Acidoferrales bacterium]|nr:extracellular solute-binding protein [Candidatus Acidoferrales bacterium]
MSLYAAELFCQERLNSARIEGAAAEGRLVWWTTTNIDLSQKILERFQKKYPFIKTELFRAGRGPLLNKVLAEALAGRHAWDVLSGSGEMYAPLLEKNLVVPYQSAESKAYDDSMMGRDGAWIAYHTNTYALGVNTRMVRPAQAPRSYEALLDPRWKDGKISLDADAYPILIGLSQAWGRERAVNYLRRLAGQNPVVKRGNDERVQLAAAGEYALVIAYASGITRVAQRGAPMELLPLEPLIIQINPLQIAARAPHPNAARLFVDFALSKEGQEMVRAGLREPARSDVESPLWLTRKNYERVVVTPENYRDYREIARLYQEIFRTR